MSSAFAQQPVLTSRGDNTRSGAYTDETLLTPANVNKGSFGHLFSVPVDYQVLAQPLYVPNVTINAQGPYQNSVHNVVYVVSQKDSVYAIDADTGVQLWYASMLGEGEVPATGHYLPCGGGQGFLFEGIVGTPVIDPTTTPNTMYLVAKSVLNGTVYHYLHALDITTGYDLASRVQITATSYSIAGHEWNFNSLHQKNRPGALLLNGVLYLGFGSNGCNDGNSGWVLAYDATPSDPTYLQQLGAFNTSPDIGLTSVWQTGNGLAADEAGNIFVSTAESANYDVPSGGQSYSNSVLKLTPPPWSSQNQTQSNPQPAAYFSPANVKFLNANDLDVSSVGPVILPDQAYAPNCSETPCHEVIASGKSKMVYVIDRDNMGGYDNGIGGTDEDLEEFGLEAGNGLLMCSPAYWNGTLYFMPGGAPLQAYQISNGLPSTTPSIQTAQRYVGSHAPSISANGNTNGIVWLVSGNNLDAFDAVSLKLLYSSSQSGTRDKFPALAHFATQTVANGKVYAATQSSLEAFGLFHILTVMGGNNQTAPILNSLPAPLQIVAQNPYTGQPDVGVTVTFSDGNKGGTFNPPTAVTDSNGAASTLYTFPSKSGTYSLTVSSPNFGNLTATEIATPAAAQKLYAVSGGKQSGAAGAVLPNPIVVTAADAYGNQVPGATVNFTSNNGGAPNPGSAVTNAKGQASTYLQLPTTVGKVTVTASSPGAKSVAFPETSVAGPAANVNIRSGNNQTASVGSALTQPLVVEVTDQYGNIDVSTPVTFSAPSGTFSSNPVNTDKNGLASVALTAGTTAGAITVTATAGSASAQFSETVTAGQAASVTVSGGNNQLAPAGTTLAQALTVVVADQYNNPVSGVAVTYSDGGAGGVFSNPNPGNTDNTGTATQFYTLPALPGTVNITATAAGVANPGVFIETGQ